MSPPTFYIGFDTEYVAATTAEVPMVDPKHPKRKGRKEMESGQTAKNDVVSYQTYAVLGDREWSWIAMMPKGRRLDLFQIIGETLKEGKKLGAFKNWPTAVTLCVHWSLPDFTSLKCLPALQTGFDSYGRGFVTLSNSYTAHFHDPQRKLRDISITLRDTLLLTPDKDRQLRQLGELLGIPKLEVAQADYEDVRGFSERDPEKFKAYALRDAEIAAKWLPKIQEVSAGLLRTPRTPTTISRLAVDHALEVWEDTGINRLDVLGLEKVVENGTTFEIPREALYFNETMSVESYYGGRNEAMFFGVTPEGDFRDWDLASAYVTALSALGMPKWEETHRARSIDDFTLQIIGSAKVRFSFPEGTRFPCLPVWSMGNLVFPLQGESYATSFEIVLARNLGAKMELANDHSYIIPMDFSIRPFSEIASRVSGKRKALKVAGKKGSLEDMLVKLMGNGVYGKLAQGKRNKRVFDTRAGETVNVPPSRISNSFLASATTGFIRAVLAEIENALPGFRMVVSATTDGLITNASDEEAHAATQGPLAAAFRNAMGSGAADSASSPILELKHRIRQVLVWRTRGQATVMPGEPCPDDSYKNLFLARAGIKCPMTDPIEQNEFMVRKFFNRLPGETMDVEQFRGLKEIYQSQGRYDLNKKRLRIAYRMDYDWKRTPHSTQRGMRLTEGNEHVWFDTTPLVSVRQFKVTRRAWEDFSKDARVLKSIQDLQDFESYLAVVPSQGMQRPRDGNPARTIIQRMFLRAYVQRMWGLDGNLKNMQLAGILAETGFPATAREVENAKRVKAEPVPCLYPSPEVLAWLAKLKAAFPSFDENAIIVDEESPWEYSSEFHASFDEVNPEPPLET